MYAEVIFKHLFRFDSLLIKVHLTTFLTFFIQNFNFVRFKIENPFSTPAFPSIPQTVLFKFLHMRPSLKVVFYLRAPFELPRRGKQKEMFPKKECLNNLFIIAAEQTHYNNDFFRLRHKSTTIERETK